jgi:hypothetical protein
MAMDSSKEKRLYERSVAAARRYTAAEAKYVKGNEISQALFRVKFEMYRVGWMIGFRAGKRRRAK